MKSRNQSLDMLRGIAVLMVIVSHYSVVVDGESAILWAAASGVDLFFVLSGFLISGLLFSEYKKTGTIDLKQFWLRRGFKIYPPFYSLISVTVLYSLFRSGKVPRNIFGELFFLQNYLPHFWPHTWSLAVEEHFYFSLPCLLLLLLWVSKGNPAAFRAIPLLSIAASVVCLYLRIWTSRHGGDWDHVAFPTHLRIDALLAGVSLGYYAHFDSQSFAEAKKTWILSVGMLFGMTLLFLPNVANLTFAYVSFLFIVAWAVNQPRSRNPLVRFLAWLGYYSYSIYLWHVLAMIGLVHMGRHWFRFPTYVISALVLGILMSKLIEYPSLRLRDRLLPSRTGEATPRTEPGYTSLQPQQISI
jgi:peptidoglycan/LPS O-acetylase OafA/YrhL